MSDLISREYAIREIQEGISENNGDFETDTAHVIDFLKVLPTVDAVPVIRCKDCKFWEQATEGSGRCIESLYITAYSTDFCSYGERRTDETD